MWAAAGLGGGPASAARSAARGAVAPSLTSLVQTSGVVPGRLGPMPWPSVGQSAVAVVGGGLMAASPGPSAPIASLTKMMTALLVLDDHPLAPGQSGPRLSMGAADVAAYVHASQTDESNVPIRRGEVLSEHQLLEALLLPSADNVADRLAVWDDHSIAAFVGKMNRESRALGLASTHYADASGVNPGSRSTARDQAVLATVLLTKPVVREIVARRAVAFPVAGTIYNVNPALGVDGIVGVKSGFTSAALGCLATASWARLDGRSRLVVAVTLHQPDGLYGAARVDEALLGRARAALVAYHPLARGATVARVAVPWSQTGTTGHLAAAPTIIGWPGMHYRTVLQPVAPARRGAPVGTLHIRSAAAELASVPIVPDATMPPMPAGWSASGS